MDLLTLFLFLNGTAGALVHSEMKHLQVNDHSYEPVFHNVGDVAELDTWFAMNVGYNAIPIKLSDKITFSFWMINSGHKDDTLVKQLLGMAAEQLSKAAGAAAAGGAGPAGGAVAEQASKKLLNELVKLFTANCDGDLARQSFPLTGKEVLSGWNFIGDYAALDDTPAGCGGNPHYQVGFYAERKQAHPDRLTPNQFLIAGQRLTSNSGDFFLNVQPDGNLVIYDGRLGNYVIWNSDTNSATPDRLILQDDGNLVFYDTAGQPIWNSETRGKPVDFAILQDDGNFVLYSPGGVVAHFNTQSNQF